MINDWAENLTNCQIRAKADKYDERFKKYRYPTEDIEVKIFVDKPQRFLNIYHEKCL